MENILPYIEANRQRFLDELFELLRIPSVSAKTEHIADMQKAALWLKNNLEAAGADAVEICETGGHPIVYAEKIIDPKLPTVLVYGHYDVQPVDPLNLWDNPPFDPVIKNNRMYARGSSDDKGQFFMHIKAFEFMMQNNCLPCNVKFMIEGEEEVGSANLASFVKANAAKLKTDVVLISDTSMIAEDIPSICVGLRGLAYMEVEVTSTNRDLHSGLFGGTVANPINILCQLIASLHDDKMRVNIPGFYDKVRNLSASERAEIAKTPFSLDAYKQKLGVKEVWGEEGFTTLERKGIRPTLDVNGIWGGYIEEGAKTVNPAKAFAKISMRLVPHQTEAEISQLFEKHFLSIAPKTVDVKVTYLHGGNPSVSPTDTKAYHAASQALEKSFGKASIPKYDGGSIPIVALFEEALHSKSVLLGFGLDTDNLHSPNENYSLSNFFKGIETIAYFFNYFAVK